MAGEIQAAFNVVYSDGPTGTPDKPEKSRIRSEVGGAIQAGVDDLYNQISGLNETVDGIRSLATTTLQWKSPARVATTANIAYSAIIPGAVIDGVTLVAGDRVLVRLNTDATQNGVVVVNSSGAATRSTDADTGAEILGMAVFVRSGTASGGKQFTCTATSPITVGTTALPFQEISDQSGLNSTLSTATTNIAAIQSFINQSPIALTNIGGTGNAITASLPTGVGSTALNVGQAVIFMAPANNTGPATITINGVAYSIMPAFGNAADLPAGALLANRQYEYRVTGTGLLRPISVDIPHVNGLTTRLAALEGVSNFGDTVRIVVDYATSTGNAIVGSLQTGQTAFAMEIGRVVTWQQPIDNVAGTITVAAGGVTYEIGSQLGRRGDWPARAFRTGARYIGIIVNTSPPRINMLSSVYGEELPDLISTGFKRTALIDNFNTVTVSGEYRSNLTTPPTGAPVPRFPLMLEHYQGEGNRAWQTAALSSVEEPYREFARYNTNAGVLGPWHEYMFRQSPSLTKALSALSDNVAARPTQADLKAASIPIVTVAQARAMSPGDRAANALWYLTDGTTPGLTLRENLPSFTAGALSINRDFDGGSYDATSSGVTTGPNVVTLRGFPSIYATLTLSAQVNGINGKNPQFRVTHRQEWPQPFDFRRYRLVWSTDPDSDEWYPFDHQSIDEGADSWVFSMDNAFQFETVYVADSPRFTVGRHRKLIARLISNPYTRPTPSALSGYRIGTYTARTYPAMGTSAPSIDQYAFCVGTGPRVFVLTGGIHPNEHVAAYQYEGAIKAITENSPLGMALREAYTFYVYPNINSQGLWAGSVRNDIEISKDANRIWEGTDVSEMTTMYSRAFGIDHASGRIDVSMDMHSYPQVLQNWYVWRRPDVAAETATVPFVAALRSYNSPVGVVDFTAEHTTEDLVKAHGTPKLAITPEHGHNSVTGPNEWRWYGRMLLQALLDITDDYVPG